MALSRPVRVLVLPLRLDMRGQDSRHDGVVNTVRVAYRGEGAAEIKGAFSSTTAQSLVWPTHVLSVSPVAWALPMTDAASSSGLGEDTVGNLGPAGPVPALGRPWILRV